MRKTPMTLEEREAHNAKARERYANLTPEQREEHNAKCREWYASMTPEQREGYLAKSRERYANLTPEQREEYLAKNRERYANLTPEQREEHNAKVREWRANMTPEEKEVYKAKFRERYANLTPEQREVRTAKMRERYANMTPEQKEARKAKEHEYYLKRKEKKKAMVEAGQGPDEATLLEKRELVNARSRKRYANQTPEQREARKAKMREYYLKCKAKHAKELTMAYEQNEEQLEGCDVELVGSDGDENSVVAKKTYEIPRKSVEERKREMSEMLDKLEEGVKGVFDGSCYAEYLRAMEKLRNYSLNNQILIWSQCPNATMVAGYNDWQKNFGRKVKRGEHGIKIIAPMTFKVKEDEAEFEEGNADAHAEMDIEKTVTLFRAITVFDVSQTEGTPLPKADASEFTGRAHDYSSILNAAIQISPYDVYFERLAYDTRGCFSPIAERIIINANLSEGQTLKTLFYEIAQAKLHSGEYSRMGKDATTKEIEAESIAYIVASSVGINTSDYSFKYVRSWSEGKTVPELKNSLKTVKAVATDMICGLERLLFGIEFSCAREEEEISVESLSMSEGGSY